jgi:pheromone shutdown protein TraB
MLLSISAHITKQLGLAPGGEFRAAHRASFNVQGCRLVLGDRPVQITLQRALSSLGFFQKIRLVFHIILANFSDVTQDDVEKCKDKDLLESLLNEMAGTFPQLSDIFVNERDLYMTYVLHKVMEKYTAGKIEAWLNCRDKVEYQPLTIVGVVGLGHMKGIESNWNKHVDQGSLLSVPGMFVV